MILIIPICAYFAPSNKNPENDQITILTTTQMLEDTVKHLIGDVDLKELNKDDNHYQKIERFKCQTSLMGMGIDPHNYKTKLSDRNKIKTANLVIVNGLHLEAKMTESFELLNKDNVWKAGEKSLTEEDKLKIDDSKDCDPHIWFDIDLWIKVIEHLEIELSNRCINPKEKDSLSNNKSLFIGKLRELKKHIIEEMRELKIKKKKNKEKLIIVTAHDAFSYWEVFSKKNNCSFELESIQGISTQTEANSKKIIELARKLADNNVKSIFTENSMPKDSLKSLQEQVNSFRQNKNLNPIKIPTNSELYSDSLGSDQLSETLGSGEYKHSTYIGAFLNNMKVIKDNLS
ncbi:metal ABC transporter solute-binding protein, Zn/Mn family [Candidatus Phytoplasma phoenicium]|uniref:Manganese ABC transporter, periplasmic-binding protein SitA n=1 Tax=Candidatus Phytoplasma phoenicium TaxID=198422 RepID=A0A0L0MK60_9MOLU|nr:zinc ABC transporter substrate-binding protein [Candidatus Phytoplasma phoenicium]KND62680.1 Manganese ABC transporter, periplasmic-binding protein SitA [Candidatus Phytoplasma phoenicium]